MAGPGTLATVRAAWPMLKQAISTGQIVRPQCQLVQPDEDIECDYDVEIPVADGYSLTANVFRSKRRRAAGEPTSVVMCAHPYDNHLTPAQGGTPLGGPPQQYRLIPQAGDPPSFSTLTSWESPDPNFWVPLGYTLVNMNLPGYANSGGPATIMSPHQGARFREAINWVGAQPWCDGNVGLIGVSYLAISQYHAAAAPTPEELPKALKCICPWEGVSDLYRDLVCCGGLADTRFTDFWWHTEVKGPMNNPLEDFLRTEGAIPPDILDAHPFFDDYWADKAVPLENITVPMLVCASFSDHELHTMGSFRAFERASSRRKWVYTHRHGKWAAFYSEEAKQLQRAFMDHFLKNADNEFSNGPSPVRLEVRSSRSVVHEVRWEDAWPLPQTQWQPLYLASDGKLLADSPEAEGERCYRGRDGSAAFEYVFPTDVELSGYMKLKVWVEARAERGQARTGTQPPPDDVAICVYVDKLDRSGTVVRFNGAVGVVDDVLARGYGRASRRALDKGNSREWLPVLAGDREEKLSPGEVVALEIAVCPSSTFFGAGEGLRLTISGRELVHAPIFKKDTSPNRGQHVLHFGRHRHSHLLVPIIAPR